MTECANSGIHIYEAYIKAKMMYFLDRGLSDINRMISNYDSVEEDAALQVYIFEFYKKKHLELVESSIVSVDEMVDALIWGNTANEVCNKFVFINATLHNGLPAIWNEPDITEMPKLSDYPDYYNYLIDKIAYTYAIRRDVIVIADTCSRPVFDLLEMLKAYHREHNMYFDNEVHSLASVTTYKWNRYNAVSSIRYSDGTWPSSWTYHSTTSSSYNYPSKHYLNSSTGYYTKSTDNITVSKTKPGIFYICESPTRMAAWQITSSGAFYYKTKYAITSTVYSRGSTLYGTVEATTRSAYPSSGYQGGYWYEYVGSVTKVVPTVSVTSISNKTVGQSVTVSATSSTPCYRMSAKYTIDNGADNWLGDVYSSSYSKTFTPTRAGTYRVTVYSRSYPESDSRSANSGGTTVTFTVSNASYTVSYNGNGNTSGSVPSSQSWISGNSLTLRTNTGNLVKTGYTFSGWNTSPNGTGTNYAAGGTYNLGSSSLTLYAKWTASTVTITWNPDGGTVSPTSVSKTANSAFGTLPTPTKSGYNFGGWYTLRNGAGTKLSTSSAVPTSNTTYYAYWTAKTVTITWNANGGTAVASQNKTSGATFGSVPATVKTGYTFVGWFTTSAATGGTQITGSSIVPTVNTTYYARWSPKTITITWNANGGLAVASQSKTVGAVFGTVPSTTRTGYTFVGWFTTSAATGGTQITGSSIVPTASTTYYARWSPKVVTITWNANGGSVSPTSSSKTVGTVFGSLPVPSRPSYSFVGWFTTSGATGGTQITSTSAVPTVGTTYFARWQNTQVVPSQLQFTKATNSSFIYVNSPEYINREDIVDSLEAAALPKRLKIFEQKNITGKNTYYQSHMSGWNTYQDPDYFPNNAYYLDVDFYNPTGSPITVKVSKLAYGNGGWSAPVTTDVPEQYLSNNYNYSFTIPAYQHKLLLKSVNGASWYVNTGVQRMLFWTDFEIMSGNVAISTILAYNQNNLTLKANSLNTIVINGIDRAIDDGAVIMERGRASEEDISGKYKGIDRNHSAQIDATMNYVINDSSPNGSLPVQLKDPYYPSGVYSPRNAWVTQINPLDDGSSSLGYAMPENLHKFYYAPSGQSWNFDFVHRNTSTVNHNATFKSNEVVDQSVINNAKSMVQNQDTSGFSPDPYALSMGSWGVPYHYTVTIVNNGNSNKHIEYWASNGQNTVVGYRVNGQGNAYTYVSSPVSGAGGYKYATISIPKNSTTTFEIITICGIGSSWLSQHLTLTN